MIYATFTGVCIYIYMYVYTNREIPQRQQRTTLIGAGETDSGLAFLFRLALVLD